MSRFRVSLSRRMVNWTVSPTECSPSKVPREVLAPILMLLMARTMSPFFRPAFSAGEFFRTSAI